MAVMFVIIDGQAAGLIGTADPIKETMSLLTSRRPPQVSSFEGMNRCRELVHGYDYFHVWPVAEFLTALMAGA